MTDKELKALISLEGETLLRNIRESEMKIDAYKELVVKLENDNNELYKRVTSAAHFRPFLSSHEKKVIEMLNLQSEVDKSKKLLSSDPKVIAQKEERITFLKKLLNLHKEEFSYLVDIHNINRVIFDINQDRIDFTKKQIPALEKEIRKINEEHQDKIKKMRIVLNKLEDFYVFVWSDQKAECLRYDSRDNYKEFVDNSFCIKKVGVIHKFKNGNCEQYTTKHFLIDGNLPALNCYKENKIAHQWKNVEGKIRCYRYELLTENIKEDKIIIDRKTISHPEDSYFCNQEIKSQFFTKKHNDSMYCFKKAQIYPQYLSFESAESVQTTESEKFITFDEIYDIKNCFNSKDIFLEDLEDYVNKHPKNWFYQDILKNAYQAFANNYIDNEQTQRIAKQLKTILFDSEYKKIIDSKMDKREKDHLLKKVIKNYTSFDKELRCELKGRKKFIPPVLHENYTNFFTNLHQLLQKQLKKKEEPLETMNDLVKSFKSSRPTEVAKALDKIIEEYLDESGNFLEFQQQYNQLRPLLPEKYNEIDCPEYGLKRTICIKLIDSAQKALLARIEKNISPLLKSVNNSEDVMNSIKKIIKIRKEMGKDRHEQYLFHNKKCWLMVGDIKYYPVENMKCGHEKEPAQGFLSWLGLDVD
ncbi:MAG: hypothetical protein HQK51_01270 [Oligoflexia bacterium]|nr:hypothetical protein [Oligoflexia bacterium]